jgi:hypothetical protein
MFSRLRAIDPTNKRHCSLGYVLLTQQTNVIQSGKKEYIISLYSLLSAVIPPPPFSKTEKREYSVPLVLSAISHHPNQRTFSKTEKRK